MAGGSRPRDACQLRDMAAHIVTGGIVAVGLAEQVEVAVGPTIIPVPPTHFQFPELLATSASTSQSANALRAGAPIEAQILGQVRSHQQRARFAIQPSLDSWRMPSVDDRDAGLAVLPGF